MKITRIEYEFCANLGNYQNEKLRMIANLEKKMPKAARRLK